MYTFVIVKCESHTAVRLLSALRLRDETLRRVVSPLFSKLYPSYSGILVWLAGASMLDERAPPMQGVLISWMLRLFIHLGTGDLTLAEKTLTSLTEAHMIEVERGLRTSKEDSSCKWLGYRS